MNNKLDKKNIEDILSLTPIQEGILFHYLRDKESGQFFEQLFLTVSGAVEPIIFKKAWEIVIKTNEALRTIFCWDNVENPLQIILKKHKLNFKYYDYTTCKDSEKKKSLETMKIRDREERFNLDKEVPFRITLCKTGKDRYVCIISNHHILYDGWSNGIILREFFNAYDAFVQGEAPVPPIKNKFKAFVKWVQDQDVDNQEKFWAPYLENFTAKTALPIKSKNQRAILEFKHLDVKLPGDMKGQLEHFVMSNQLTLASLFYGVWGILLLKYNNCDDVVFGTTLSGRAAKLKGIENMVGLFINTLPLRVETYSGDTILELLRRVRQGCRDREEYETTSLINIKKWSEIEPGEELFDSIVAIENYPLDQRLMEQSRTLAVGSFDIYDINNYDLTVGVTIFNDVEVRFSYNNDLFEKGAITALSHHFLNILQRMISNPDGRVSDLEIISREEKQRLLNDFNNTAANYPVDKTINQLFEEQVERTPDNIAVLGAHQLHGLHERASSEGTRGLAPLSDPISLTYMELNRKSHQLAYLLIEKGVKPDTIVGIMLEPCLEMIVVIIAILRSGGAYLPIDPDYPGNRVRYMLNDSNVGVLLTTPKLQVKVKAEVEENLRPLPQLSIQVIVIETELASAFESTLSTLTSTLTCQVSPANLAYIIYTSGTTGRPKGTLIEHRNVVRLMVNNRFQFSFSPHDIWTMFHSYCFDFSVWEMYGALLYGGKLIVISKTGARDTVRYLEILKRQAVTVLNQTPSAFYNLMELELQETGKELQTRYVIFGGEALSPGRLKKWKAKYPGTRLINMYGITETTVHVTFKEIGDSEIEENISNIGSPIPTLSTYVLDRYLNLQPIGIAGELCVGGEGLGRGYLNRPALTDEKFKRTVISHSSLVISPSEKLSKATNDQCPMTNDRLYRTGDLARWLSNGELEYLGRIDQQVKIRGYRIELGEIENKLLRHEEITESIVLAKEDRGGDKYLCAYIVSKNELKVTQLREYLQEELPGYMIPAYFVKIDRFPLTVNGKIDRSALPEPVGIGPASDVLYVPPRSDVEKKLVETWEQVLGNSPIGIHENFFMIGGDSIKTIQIAARMNKAGYRVEMKDVFEHPTISELAPFIKPLGRIADQSIITGIIPLTPIQQRFFENRKEKPHYFNQAVMLYSHEGFEEEAVKETFEKIHQHHDALRMSFKLSNRDNGKIIQENRGLDYPLSLRVFDFRNRTKAIEALEAAVNETQADINLEKGPLMKLGLFHLDDGDRLLIVIHHLVVDGVSWRILFEDIETLYRQYKKGNPLVLPLKTDSFKVWAEKLAGFANSDLFLKEKKHWAHLESTEIPLIEKDFAEGNNYSKDRALFSFSLSEEETEGLLTTANSTFGTEVNDLLLTGLGLAVGKVYGHDRLLIAMEGHGREEILPPLDIKRTVGWFTAIYPIILDISYQSDLSRQIIEVKETLRAIPHKGVGYAILKYLTADEHKKEIDFRLNPQISFNYLGQFDEDLAQKSFKIAEETVGESVSITNQREYELEVIGIVRNKRLEMSIHYNKNQYKGETIQKLQDRYQLELNRVLLYCSGKKERQLTPSDLTYPGISIESINRLQKQYCIEDIYNCSPMQEGMLFHALYNPDSSAYFVQASYRFHGELDVGLVEESLEKLFKRHDILRTVFFSEGFSRPVQVVLKERQPVFYYQDLRYMLAGKGQSQGAFIKQFKEKDRNQRFDLNRDVLVRVTVLQLDELEYEFTWSFHHILMDGWCTGILNAEFFAIYTALLENKTFRLPAVTPYREYIKWLERQDKEKAREYWGKLLTGYHEPAGIPKKKGIDGSSREYKREEFHFILDCEKTKALAELANETRVTLSVILKTIWGIMLMKYNDRREVVFGIVVSGRPGEIEGVESMVGLFINTIPVRIQAEQNMEFIGLVQQVQEQALQSEPHHHYSLAEIQSQSKLKQHLMDHFLTFLNYPDIAPMEKTNPINFKISNIETLERSNYDLDVLLYFFENLKIKLRYNTNVYDSQFMKKLAEHIKEVIDQVLKNNRIRVDDIKFSHHRQAVNTNIPSDDAGDFDL